MDDLIQTITVYAIPVIFAITLHEAAHGYVARMFGDSTAWMLGRVSLNPMRHIDPIGTLLVPALLLISARIAGGGGFMFGWAKPVPVNFANLRNPKRDMIWVAAAGPAANLAMACGWALFYRLLDAGGVDEPFFLSMAKAGITFNIMLMALNLVPIPPLDGGRILIGLLPRKLSLAYASVERYGFIIVLVLIVTGLLSTLMMPFVSLGIWFIQTLFQF
ncbi:site-2 protease family protein [Derxia gummosa]|uniref:Site-2 protease family protein n=1 Tax=Derxia gummosa DSM 723 TaxID=1121388 RepID=A0A8B6X481_9BURK|nr:site-2 protease family protein [Derxia gummosa]